ncbi:hypothetical protein ACFLS9_06770 [Bacteroidota bacterium]
MSLKDILEDIVKKQEAILLCDTAQEWEAANLLQSLPNQKLKRRAYFQQGLYIAEINDSGYLGRVLYKIKRK